MARNIGLGRIVVEYNISLGRGGRGDSTSIYATAASLEPASTLRVPITIRDVSRNTAQKLTLARGNVNKVTFVESIIYCNEVVGRCVEFYKKPLLSSTCWISDCLRTPLWLTITPRIKLLSITHLFCYIRYLISHSFGFPSVKEFMCFAFLQTLSTLLKLEFYCVAIRYV